MAKYHGIGGRRIGSVGNETYAMTKDGNIVKAKITHTRQTRSEAQVKQRCFMGSAVKASKQIGPDFLNGCFELKSRRLSDVNKFMSLNTKRSCILPKDMYKNEKVMSFGNFQISQGSIMESLIVQEVTDNTDVYNGIALSLTDYASDLTTVTVGKVSTDLLAQYPSLKEGMLINAFGLVNDGVTYSATEFLSIGNDPGLIHAKQNFILNKADTSEIVKKGFKVVKVSNATNYGLVLLNEDFSTKFEGGKKAFANPGYVCFFAAHKEFSRLHVSNSSIVGNTAYNNIVTALVTDLNGDKKALHTYEIGSNPVIVNDNLI